MSDRRQPQIAAVLKRLEGHQHDHVIEAVAARITEALAGSPDTSNVTVDLPMLGADTKAYIRGLPAALGQRPAQKLAG